MSVKTVKLEKEKSDAKEQREEAFDSMNEAVIELRKLEKIMEKELKLRVIVESRRRDKLTDDLQLQRYNTGT
jgi:flagellar biosynthesis chaperone FliJ